MQFNNITCVLLILLFCTGFWAFSEYNTNTLIKSSNQRLWDYTSELWNEIECLEWKYERDMVRDLGKFRDRKVKRRVFDYQEGFIYGK